ncbi:hypothetical protein [Paenibacillus lutrae]|uniref:Uncharacterized protein n=1 Tax=Paenibacillus lutrae TaxID=2078573 RepID=A0A7X3K1N1_9BACL|nr:hypothetical protein [Paenibacillus lutrae]MVP02484.1 hypothetical protein [Paenibacillus lutrae]
MHDTDDKQLDELEKSTSTLLRGYLVTTPTRTDTSALLGRLQVHFDVIRENAGYEADPEPAAAVRPSLLVLCKHQFTMYNKWFWLLSIVLFAMLLMINSTLPMNGPLPARSSYSLAFPLLLVCGFLYQYRSWNEGMRMIESVTPYPPALLMFSRLVVLLFMIAILGIAGSLYTFTTLNEDSRTFAILPFVFDWIAPLLLVSGLTALVLMKKGMSAAVIAAGTGWGAELAAEGWLRREFQDAAWNWTFILQVSLIAAGLLLLLSAYRSSLRLATVRGWQSI